jgi:phosphoglycolate phosphatase-like HAD superfamily hydrolase
VTLELVDDREHALEALTDDELPGLAPNELPKPNSDQLERSGEAGTEVRDDVERLDQLRHHLRSMFAARSMLPFDKTMSDIAGVKDPGFVGGLVTGSLLTRCCLS